MLRKESQPQNSIDTGQARIKNRQMHELSIAQRMCETVIAHTPSKQRVLKITVELGPLCGIVPDALAFCFPVVAPSFGLSQARLCLKLIRATASCPQCEMVFNIETMWETCPKCDYGPVTISGGQELRIKEIEVEEIADV